LTQLPNVHICSHDLQGPDNWNQDSDPTTGLKSILHTLQKFHSSLFSNLSIFFGFVPNLLEQVAKMIAKDSDMEIESTANGQTSGTKVKQLPVTLLSGFLVSNPHVLNPYSRFISLRFLNNVRTGKWEDNLT
jgi:alpha-amylase/alpha-mannosidase (GH57 family)